MNYLNIELLTAKELGTALKVPPNTIYYWVSRKEIPYQKFGKHYRFELQQVLKAFEDKENLAKNILPSEYDEA